ncbi:dynein axonemal assembly factor 11-like [Watersipora subatra]|uniref:dynein axonemal assembly factor 11-like n=1 Tax=Watersipora subatra TaxID=2589382 RepID=UPI00355B6D1D
MVVITEDLVRKRAEHNELQISTLEELSLHQQDIEKIEYLDKWCRDLKILYLQSNLIEKIENVSRLKKLEYLNLALNNIERVENLEGCESLNKLDLTVNFVGELTSISCLQDLEFFQELYLTGNPCTEYEGYKDYVIATLPQLQKLDGVDVEKSERIAAIQNYSVLKRSIEQQQQAYVTRRNLEREEERKELGKKKARGFDGRWYTDVNSGSSPADDDALWEKEKKAFWEETTAYTPESRKQVHAHMQKAKERDEKKDEKPEVKKERRLFNDADGRPLNVNEAKVDFTIEDDEENGQYILNLSVFKHLDTSLLDADVNPFYVRVIIKGKIFQLCLDEEVSSSKSTAQRSTTTGHLVITMPKVKHATIASHKKPTKEVTKPFANSNIKSETITTEKLEVDPSMYSMPDIGNIVKQNGCAAPVGTKAKAKVPERANSPDFVDNPDVPPLRLLPQFVRMAATVPERLGIDKGHHNLKIGKSFENGSKESFHTIRYDFKPASVDTNQESSVTVGDDGGVEVTVPHVQGSGTTHTVYKGNKRPLQKECVLIINHETGEIALEKLSYAILLKKTRSDPSARIVTNPRPLTPIDKTKSSPMRRAPMKPHPSSSAIIATQPTSYTGVQKASRSAPAVPFGAELGSADMVMSSESSSDSSSGSGSSDSDSDDEQGNQGTDQETKTAPPVTGLAPPSYLHTLSQDLRLSESSDDDSD